MDDTIQYLNTDLVLTSAVDLTELAAHFDIAGMYTLSVDCGDDNLWYGSFETNESHHEPESNIAAMIVAIESLNPQMREVWDRCQKREFNIGYDCGNKPWAFNQGLSNELLRRIASIGASLRVTLYPDKSSDGSS